MTDPGPIRKWPCWPPAPAFCFLISVGQWHPEWPGDRPLNMQILGPRLTHSAIQGWSPATHSFNKYESYQIGSGNRDMKTSLWNQIKTRALVLFMAPHSSTLAWKIPWMEEPGRLQSMRSLRVGHDWATSLSFFTFMHWRRKWQPTPVFLPGESQGWGSLVGCHLWGRTESDTTEAT